MEVIIIEPTKPETPENSNLGVVQVYSNKEEPERKESAKCEVEQGMPNNEGIQIRGNPEKDKNQEEMSSGSVVEIIGTSERKPPPSYSRYDHRRMSNENLMSGLPPWDSYVNMNKSSSILKHLNNSFVEVISARGSYEKVLYSHSTSNGENLPPPTPGYISIESTNLNNGSTPKHSLSDLSPNSSRRFLPAIAESSFEVEEPSSDHTNTTQNRDLALVENKGGSLETLDLVSTTSQDHKITKSKPQEVGISNTKTEHLKLNEIQKEDDNFEKESTVTSQNNLDKTSNDKVTDTSVEDVNDHRQSVIIEPQSKFYSVSDDEEYHPKEVDKSSTITSGRKESSEHHTEMTCILHIDNSVTMKSKDTNFKHAPERFNDNVTNTDIECNFQWLKPLTKSQNDDFSNNLIVDEMAENGIVTITVNSTEDSQVLKTTSNSDVDQANGNVEISTEKTDQSQPEKILQLNDYEISKRGTMNEVIQSSEISSRNKSLCHDVIYIVDKIPDNGITVISNIEKTGEGHIRDENCVMIMPKTLNHPIDHTTNQENDCEKDSFSKEKLIPKSLKDDDFIAKHDDKSKSNTSGNTIINYEFESTEHNSTGLESSEDFSDNIQNKKFVTNSDHIIELNVLGTNKKSVPTTPTVEFIVQESLEEYLTRKLVKGGNFSSEIYVSTDDEDSALSSEDLVTRNQITRRHSSPVLDVGPHFEEVHAFLNNEKYLNVQNSIANKILDDESKIKKAEEISSQAATFVISSTDKHEENDIDEVTPNTNLNILNDSPLNYLDPFSDSNNEEQGCNGEQTTMKSKERSISSPTIAVEFSTINSANTNIKSDSLLEKCVKKFNLKPFFRKRKSIKHEESSIESDISNNLEAADDKPPSSVVTNETVGDNSDKHLNTSEDDTAASQQGSEATSHVVNAIQLDVTDDNFGLNSQTVYHKEEALNSKTDNSHDCNDVSAFNNISAEDVVVYNCTSRNDTKIDKKQSIEIISERDCNLEEDRQATFLQFSPTIKVDP